MFVKIKLEPQNSKKKITYIPVDDDATVNTLKKAIEQYVKVPAERQEIRTLAKSFADSRKVGEICDVKGSSLMLYAHDESCDYKEPKFVCFLQIYNNEMALKQQEMALQRPSHNIAEKLSTPSNSISCVTLVAESDSNSSSSDGSESETASSNNCSETNSENSSSDDSDNSKSSRYGKKRQKHFKNDKNPKKLKSTTARDQLSPTLCKYLDEFPKCDKMDRQMISDIENNKAQKTNRQNNNLPNASTTDDDNKELDRIVQKPQPADVPSKKTTLNNLLNIQSHITSTTTDTCHPCRAINPENRQYMVIISKNGNDINHCELLLDWFFDRFRSCESSSQLQFTNNDAVTLFEGKIWIACLNKQTFEWVSLSLAMYPLESYNIEPPLNEGNRNMCEVVIPMVSNSKNMLDIFDLLEKQNGNLSTLKWCVANRTTILPEDKHVSSFCTNELLNISMDNDSKEFIEKSNFKLKYCFWQIVFNFVNI